MIRAMIVDDDDDVRLLARMIIERSGGEFSVRGEATNGQEALQLINSVNPDILVLDFVLPDLSGIEVAKVIWKSRPAQKIVLISAHMDPTLRKWAGRAGIKDCIHTDDIRRLPETLREMAIA